ncbi:hypothetical protein PRIPAC_86529, partial [Pristionchus pacificus]|uniref:Uncharacterized protein n=1 Tax=Pristionchus pacificus TaxID=54126 RepID=A0A2A6BLT1_PRIPA
SSSSVAVMSSTPLKTQSTAKSSTSASASDSSVTTASTMATTPAFTPVSPGKMPAPPSSLPVSPISPASSKNSCISTRSDSISFGSILAPDPPSAEKATVAVSMTAVNEAKSEVELEEAHEIHCDHLSVYSQTSGTASYMTVEPVPDFALHYSKKKRPKSIHQGKLTLYGDAINAKRVVLHPHNAQPLRCKANPKLLKLLNSRQKAIRKANSRVRRDYQITAVRILPRDSSRPVIGDRDMGIGHVEVDQRSKIKDESEQTHIAALTEFIASPISAHSRLLISTKFDETNANVVSVDIDVIDERAGGREEEDDIEVRVPDAQVRADFYSTLDRPPVRSTESLANVLTDCEASTMMKAHDASTAKPISARPAGGLFSRMFKRLTFGVFG